MPHHRPQTAFARTAALIAGLFVLASCSEYPVEPKPKAPLQRTVTAVLRDSLGDPIANVGLFWTAQFLSDGGETLMLSGFSDEDGENHQVLTQGGWIVTAGPISPQAAPRVAGASLVVAGGERAPSDTQVVDLTMHTGSRMQGIVTLAGRTDHRGTAITNDLGTTTYTDSTGAWALYFVPLGRWTILMGHFGFKTAIDHVDVVTPGSVVIVPPVALVSDP